MDALRDGLDVRGSRELALALVAEAPEDPATLWRAARAECDGVLLHHAHEKDQRALAALSALDYAERAQAAGAGDARALAWIAFARGGSTHLRPMLSRARVARETKEAADAAIALDPSNATANQALAILNHRLATLPWIARTMAVGEPESSLQQAEAHARAALGSQPGVETSLVLAGILVDRDKGDEARALLADALAREDRQPRDPYFRDEARALLKELAPAGEASAGAR